MLRVLMIFNINKFFINLNYITLISQNNKDFNFSFLVTLNIVETELKEGQLINMLGVYFY
jgi:hypothetical protein